jgi:serine phosphatase RsbU (regulator of sigma subunit)
VGISILLVMFATVALVVYKGREKQKKANVVLLDKNKEIQEKKDAIETQAEELRQQKEEIQAINDQLEAQKTELAQTLSLLENKNGLLTDSIRAAYKVQQSILPLPEQFNTFASEFFILFRPKDIVSGDFYWVGKNGEDTFLAVADCTGHGVPGAFMTMVGTVMLDKIIGQRGVNNPAQVLELLNEEVNRTFKHESTGSNDGMDIMLAKFSKRPNGEASITVSGSKMKMLYTKNNVFHELKGDRKSIGGNYVDNQSFTNTELSLSKGDTLYFFSDGFADQNNPSRIKIGFAQLRESINNISGLPMVQQKEALLGLLSAHQQSEAQRDDILVVGVRIN